MGVIKIVVFTLSLGVPSSCIIVSCVSILDVLNTGSVCKQIG